MQGQVAPDREYNIETQTFLRSSCSDCNFDDCDSTTTIIAPNASATTTIAPNVCSSCHLSSEALLRDSCSDCNFDFQLRCQMLENALFLKTIMCLKTHPF